MRAWEIDFWNCGAKIRREDWPDGEYIVFEALGNGKDGWHNKTKKEQWVEISNSLCCHDDWELYVEPAKTRKVKMYAPVRRYDHMGEFFLLGTYDSKKVASSGLAQVVGWHEIEVEVTE